MPPSEDRYHFAIHGIAPRNFARETCFLVVLLLGYRIVGAFGPWKDIRALPIVQFTSPRVVQGSLRIALAMEVALRDHFGTWGRLLENTDRLKRYENARRRVDQNTSRELDVTSSLSRCFAPSRCVTIPNHRKVLAGQR